MTYTIQDLRDYLSAYFAGDTAAVIFHASFRETPWSTPSLNTSFTV